MLPTQQSYQKHRKWWPSVDAFIQHHKHVLCIGDLEALLLGNAQEEQGPHVMSTPARSPGLHSSSRTNGSDLVTEKDKQGLRAAVFLSDTSQELLLSIVPPLHPVLATQSPSGTPQPLSILVGDPATPVHQLLDSLPPVGHELVVEVVGIAADDRSQAVAIQGPSWLSSPAPTNGTSAAASPYLLVSHTPDVHPDEAGTLISLGLAGALGDCFQPLDECLPLVGVLGVLSKDGSRALTSEELQQLQQQQMAYGATQGQDLLVHRVAGSGSSSIPLPRTGMTSQGVIENRRGADGNGLGGLDTQPSEVARASFPDKTSQASQAQAQEAPQEAGATTKDEDFEMWMQLDERAAPGAHLPPKRPAAPHAVAGGAPAAAFCAPYPPVPGERCRWLDDVSVGDLVEVVPLSAHAPVLQVKTDAEEAGEIVEERVQGIVDEVMLDDMFQARGVLVRLQEDNTMGNVARILASKHRQHQQEWPSLLQGVEAPDGEAGKAEELETAATAAAADLHSSAAASKTKAKKQQRRNGSTCITVNRPVGGVQVLYKPSRKNGRAQDSVAKHLQAGGLAMGAGGMESGSDDSGAANVRALQMWQLLQESYGEFVTAAVLKDCKGDVEQAITVLLDQDSLLERLTRIVENNVQQVEDQVAASAAAAAEQEAARYECATNGKRQGGWAGARPGIFGGSNLQPSDPSSFPSLSSQHCNRTGRHPRAKHKPGMTDSWGGSETLTGPIKVLQNTDSLSNLAHQHGLAVRDIEALKQLFPTLDNPFIVSTLADVKGDVTAALNYLLDAGILPGAAPEIDYLLDLGGESSSSNNSALNKTYLAAAASSETGSSQQGFSTANASIPEGPHDGSFEEKVVWLLDAFEGLDSSLADFTLRQCNENLAAAVTFLNECLHADNNASAASLAQSEAVAAAIARPDSYAGVAEVPGLQQASTAAGIECQQPSQGNMRWANLQQQQQASTEDVSTQSRAEGASCAQDGWQQARPREWKGGMGASAKDAADKERSRLQAGKARQIAHIYFNFRNVFFQQAHAAYNAGDGKAAAEFSQRGRKYGELAKQFRQASNEEAYKASNLGIRNTFVMDLHGMHVNEAMALLERQMDALGRLVSPEGVLLRCITGWGAHSAKGIALIKPAVLNWAKMKGLKHFVEPGNDGVVIVHVTPNDSRYDS